MARLPELGPEIVSTLRFIIRSHIHISRHQDQVRTARECLCSEQHRRGFQELGTKPVHSAV
jgi:hypothetical protein